MKISKVLIVCSSSLLLCGVMFAAKTYNIQASVKNAVQHIWLVEILDQSAANRSAKIDGEKYNVRIGGNTSNDAINFLLTWNWNVITSSKQSSVLWWNGNRVSWLSSKLAASTILAWKNNTVNSDYSVVNGGEQNTIASNSESSIIMWWTENSVNNDSKSSAIVWWSNNDVYWRYSTIAWSNSEVRWDGSVALWSDITIKWDGSFLWSDGTKARELSWDSMFVVGSQNWMVINADVAHTWAQLTVGWSLVVSQQTWVNIVCEAWTGAWVMKLVDKEWSSTQKCLCSCDGYGWHSLVWNGQCETVCNGTNQAQPKCGTGLSVVKNWSGLWTYLWTCEAWFPIDDSYLVTRYSSDDWKTKGDKVQWVCQESNGSVDYNTGSASYTGCEFIIKCEGTIPANAHRNNNIVPSLDPSVNRNYKYSDNVSVLCSYSCDDGYLWNWSQCKEICKKSTSTCNIWTPEYVDNNWTTDYYYNCKYTYNWGTHTQRCDTYCVNPNRNDNMIWSPNEKKCVNVDWACWADKYTCNYWTPSKTSMDEVDRVGKDFTWKCQDWLWNPIKSCTKAKTREDKPVYFNVSEAWNIKTVRFTLNWSLTLPINVKLLYSTDWWSFVDNYAIGANAEISEKKSYDSSLGNIALSTPYFEDDEIPQWEKVYKLKIVNWSISNYCASSCSMAWQCLYWATSSNYSSSINWNKMNFTWKCGSQSCSASCRINTSSCSAKPSWATSCDATADSECVPLSSQTITINKDNFYMYSTEEVISSSACWTKRHSVKNPSWYMNYTMETQYCTQNWFKCDYGKVLSWCNCVDICTSISGVWKCNGGATVTLPSATWTNSYSYTCTLWSDSHSCTATCPTWKYWNGTSCASAPSVCGSTHNNCVNGASMSENAYVEASHIYKWKCTLWDISKLCLECESNYTLDGTNCKPVTVGCDKTNIDGYSIPAMNHGGSETVTKTDSVKKCTNTASCNNGTVTLWTDNCTVACDETTNPWWCNLGSPSNYAWTKWWYLYEYYCWDFKCGIECSEWTIWDGGKCVDKVDPCDYSTANQCIQWTAKNRTSNDLGDTRDCLDANNKKLNSWVCYKCKWSNVRNGNKCAKPCKTTDNKTWTDWKTWTAYKGSQYTCTDNCGSNTIDVKCDDGKFVYNWYPNETVTTSIYNNCNTKSYSCNSTTYNLTECPDHWNCSPCTSYSVSNWVCTSGDTRYELNSCKQFYEIGWDWKSCVDATITAYAQVEYIGSSYGINNIQLCVWWWYCYSSSNCVYLTNYGQIETCEFNNVPLSVIMNESGILSSAGIRHNNGSCGLYPNWNQTVDPNSWRVWWWGRWQCG